MLTSWNWSAALCRHFLSTLVNLQHPHRSLLLNDKLSLGVDASGALMILTIDGAENRGRGMNMTELASAFADLGANMLLI